MSSRDPVSLPAPIQELVESLIAMPGACAVALGGSRAEGGVDARSDWDLGVYYRGTLDTTRLSQRGTVHPPGSWGRLMNGGAWLVIDGTKVDVLLRDLDVVEYWSDRAETGHFEVDALLGYLAGCPTYMLRAELAWGRVLHGSLPRRASYPEPLAVTAQSRWRFSCAFSLEHARMRAARGDVVGAMGQAAKAAIEHAHAVLAGQRTWVLNEKRILERAGLAELHALFSQSLRREELVDWVSTVRAALGVDASVIR
ncbi:nucleotidyltransferase domain-containing protein [Pyxidicoccus fallax]|uniref:Nucleotidyltransferase domain-containing protein n=1 Tax=Pyxidicoccus fallax TaxID=394095 RepID=A0A848LTY2_9BACT|nr:nucleotidyltransferase domain-containing protein [Pyxidicoccus fallax]NMO21458.1 nucleotidyltransferase domain-containing protein [Pyxidicoccus fallax]NPC82667.1 nucleotidyltransferase domain-containing protein [Pyxidicoccus fallax]